VTRATFGGSGRGTDTIIYAALIIAIAVFYPSGIVGWWRARCSAGRARATHERARQCTCVGGRAVSLLELHGVSKRFGGLTANQDVSFTSRPARSSA
jgi:hypothetical protein